MGQTAEWERVSEEARLTLITWRDLNQKCDIAVLNGAKLSSPQREREGGGSELCDYCTLHVIDQLQQDWISSFYVARNTVALKGNGTFNLIQSALDLHFIVSFKHV